MEQESITLFTVIALGLLFTLRHFMEERAKKGRPKELWVIEDSDSDYEFLTMFCHFENTALKRFKSADNLLWKFLNNTPDRVIVDYRLSGKIRGDKVVALCRMFGVKCKLITGDSQPILGIDESDIIRKGTGREWCREIQNWFDLSLA